MKVCAKCLCQKEEDLFCKDKSRKDGLHVWCKLCHNEYYKNNKEKALIYSKKYYKNNRKKEIDKRKLYYKHNKEKLSPLSKMYRENNKEKISIYLKEYNKNNKEKINVQRAKYTKHRCKVNIQFKLVRNLRIRLYCAIKNNQKVGSSIRDLGCTIDYLKSYLEHKWQQGMSWNNYGSKEGQWSIDHIKPLSKFDLTDREQLLEAVNFRNLQPMWHVENIKKSNK